MTTDPQVLLAEILARPDDDEPRLVYADWLTQQGDPRGEFITVQCALATGTGDYSALAARERELLAAHAKEWTAHIHRFGTPTLRRGFVATIKTSAARFAAEGGPFFERDPIEELIVQRGDNQGLAALGAAPHLARLRRLELRRTISSKADADAVATWLRSPYLAGLRELQLVLHFHDRAEPYFAHLFDHVEWPALERLALHAGRLPSYTPAAPFGGPEPWRSFATAKLPALRALSIDPYTDIDRVSAAFPDARIRRLVL